MHKKLLSLLIIACLLMFAGCSSKPAALSGAFSEDDLGISVGGDTFYLREDSAKLLEALGGEYDFSEVVSCVYDGKDKTYAYDGITVSTVPVGGKDIIEMITITSGAYSTLRGISVGQAKADIMSVYGEDYFDDGYITYSLTNDPSDIQSERIQFELNGDTIAKIYIYSPSY